MKILRSESGFTLIELVLIIVILGILGAVATIQFGNIIQDSKDAAVQGTAGSVSAQLATAINNAKALPDLTAGDTNCNTATTGDNSFKNRVYNCLTFSGKVFKDSTLTLTATTAAFNVCTGAACTGATGTSCGSTSERFIRVTYTSASGALTFTSPAACAS